MIISLTVRGFRTRSQWIFVVAEFYGSADQGPVRIHASSFCTSTSDFCLLISFLRSSDSASVSESVTFNGGKKKDKNKDENCLAAKIPEGKRAIADSAFKASAKASTSKPGHSRELNHFMSRVRSRMETLFLRFKVFGILSQRFRHNVQLHKDILNAVAVLVAYDMENGHPLFDV